jgi:hypothetical protein
MIKASCCVCGSLLLVLFSHLGVALADQATKLDLAGKKICWSDGQTTFGNDGSFHSTRYMNGAWRLIGDKLLVTAANGGFTATIIKRKGTSHVGGYATGHEPSFGTWGKYCI